MQSSADLDQRTVDPPSDAETEHLPFDDEEEEGTRNIDLHADGDSDIVMHPSQLEHDELPAGSQGSAIPSAMSSPQKAGAFTGDEFSDESDLTDDDDDQNNQADEDEDDQNNQADDASSLSDDDLGGSDDDDEEDEEEDDDGAKDEAAEALAALTGPSTATAADGLEGLAALAAAGAGGDDEEEDEDEDEEEEEEEDEESEPETSAKKHSRVQALARENDDDGFSSDITPEPEDEDGEGEMDDDAPQRTTDLDLIASMKKRAAATGGATSLLEPQQLVDDSLPGSATTSRAVSPVLEDDALKVSTDVDPDAEQATQLEEEEEAEALDTAAGTPAPDVIENDDDTTTDEAAIRRQEAMEELTKIEIGFAMLRDRLYVERLEEISREGDMIFDGTHPELLHLTKAIDVRRQRRTQLVELYFEEQQHQYERVAKAEEFAAWSIWRSNCAGLRRDMMDDLSRKRRRLDREKRSMDVPRPVRRHQVFETELVRNLDRIHPNISYNDDSSRKRRAAVKRRAKAQMETEASDEFVAYPDLKGLAESDVIMDIDRMGIRPAGAPPGMYDPFYASQMGMEFPGPEFYAMYGPDAAAAAAAHAHMTGTPFGFQDGRGGPPPLPPLPSGRVAGSSQGHPGIEMGMMGGGGGGNYDPYAAADMERAARIQQREHAARMGFDPNDPHYRGSPFPPDAYSYPAPPFGENMEGSRGLMGLPSSPPPPPLQQQQHRGTGGRMDRIVAEDGGSSTAVGANSSRARGSPSSSKPTNRSKQPLVRPTTTGPPPPLSSNVNNPNLPRPISSFTDTVDSKPPPPPSSTMKEAAAESGFSGGPPTS